MKILCSNIYQAVLAMLLAVNIAQAQDAPKLKEKDAADKPKAENVRRPEIEREKQMKMEKIRKDQPELKERIQAMDREIKELINQGQKEEAAQLQKERDRVKEKLMAKTTDGGYVKRPVEFREGGDLENRLRHAQEAAEHLKIAGMFDLAERVMQQAQRMKAAYRPERGGGSQTQMDMERLERLEMKVMRLGEMIEELRAQKGADRLSK